MLKSLVQPDRTKIVCVGAVLLALLCASPARSQVRYNVIDLGTLGGSRSSAMAINNRGQVAGESFTADGQSHAFLYSGGSMTDLGTLTGTAYGYSVAYGINNLGQVVGVSSAANGRHAFLYSNGTMTDIDTLGNTDSVGREINDHGQITGEIAPVGSQHAFLYQGGVMTNLGAYSSAGRAINNAGVIVGNSMYGHFAKYDNGWVDLDPDSTIYSDASDINDLEVIVGYYQAGSSSQHGFVYSNGVRTDLGVLGSGMSGATAINNLGQIVGWSPLDTGQHRAVIYEDGSAIDLNSLIDATSGWTLSYAGDINDNGWIVGIGSTSDSIKRGFLLVPVPEPSTIALLLAGAVGLLAYAWRRWRAV
jgi:probable HAF family extracellular repeat protein